MNVKKINEELMLSDEDQSRIEAIKRRVMENLSNWKKQKMKS